MRVHYLSLHEPSGYSVAARRCMLALAEAGVAVRWVPFVPGAGIGLGYEPAVVVDDAELGPLLNGPEDCDAVVAHLVPEYWPYVRELYGSALLVGQTVWETDRLPQHWPALLDVADRIVVPTGWNAGAMRAAGVRAQIHVVPHVAPPERTSESTMWSSIPRSTFVCYTIGPWTARKATADVVDAYQRAFAGRDDTLLVVKTSARDYTQQPSAELRRAGPGTTAYTLARLLARVRDPAPVRLVTQVLGDDDVLALELRGDCCVSLSHGEGWSLPVFDAAALGTPVVASAYGGPLAYLDDASSFLVDCKLVPVDDPASASYTPDQTWAQASVAHAASLLLQVEADRAGARARAGDARSRIVAEFSPAAVAAALVPVLGR
jgi:glycosyltransferase involved in cell wall biosynthesis